MKEITIQVPDGKKAEWVNGVLTLIDEAQTQRDDRPITERIKTFEDAMVATGMTIPLDESMQEELGKDAIAYLKLRIIAAALNEGWKPTFSEGEEWFYPWFVFHTKEEVADMDEEQREQLWLVGGGSYIGARCGLACSYSGGGWSVSAALVSARLAVKSEELAVYFGKQFIGIWAEYVGPFLRDDKQWVRSKKGLTTQ